ncbi:DUF1641 domain-containing protein [Tautonia rosea]|uniref:DUF1641 domain-containing protein n=1 Tax=Tautonia rosea TaxID=2728037 RepID=UPI00147516D5|nr:DUF1641 domain-containing protein [Tautonia rosea]
MNPHELSGGRGLHEANSEAVVDVMTRLLERVEHIDRVVSRLERLADEAPPLVATAVDAFDESCRTLIATGAGPDERLARLLQMAKRLTDDDTSQALDRLLDRASQLEGAMAALDKLPGLLAVVVDTFDEYAAMLAAQGIDVEKSVRQGIHALLWLGQRVSEAELERLGILLRSDVLEPHALAVVGKTGRALATCHEYTCSTETPDQIGPIGLLRTLSDPDVRRSMGFLVKVARCFGQNVATPSNH